MSRESENYLDQLLNSVQGKETQQNDMEMDPLFDERELEEGEIIKQQEGLGGVEDSFVEENQPEGFFSQVRKRRKLSNKKRKERNNKAQEAYLEEFEKELNDFETEKFLSDFEIDIEKELVREQEEYLGYETNEIMLDPKEDKKEKEDNTENTQEQTTHAEQTVHTADDLLSGMFDVMTHADDNVQVSTAEETDDELLNLLSGLQEDVAMEEADTADEYVAVEEKSDATEEPEKVDGAEESVEETEESAEDILAMLDGLGEENEDLADISNMLKADENHEDVSDEGDLTNSLADSLADLGFEVNPEDEAELSSIKEVSSYEKTVETVTTTEDKPKKKGFFKRLGELFFGPEENEITQEKPTQQTTEASEISDENLDILKALEGGASPEDPKEDKKAAKKAAKEAKKKEAEERKAAKAKEKEAAKKAKAAKPKKPKKPKVKDNTPPLPKLPVFLIFLMAASIIGAVLYSSNGIHYNMVMGNAKEQLSQGNYYEAYGEIAGLKIKEKDQNLAEELMVLASMDQLVDSYDILMKAKHVELAVDSLIRVIGHYDANIEKAGELGFSAEITELEGKAEEILTSEYGISYEQAIHLYNMRSRVKYSIALVTILQEAGKN